MEHRNASMRVGIEGHEGVIQRTGGIGINRIANLRAVQGHHGDSIKMLYLQGLRHGLHCYDNKDPSYSEQPCDLNEPQPL